MDTKFTPGPWFVTKQETPWGTSVMVTDTDEEGEYAICEMHEDCLVDARIANAKLIASAPEMYALLKDLDTHFDIPRRSLDAECVVEGNALRLRHKALLARVQP